MEFHVASDTILFFMAPMSNLLTIHKSKLLDYLLMLLLKRRLVQQINVIL